MSDLMREQFDAWHKSELAKLIAAKEVEAARHMQGLKGSLFCAWEASRAALVVELPESEIIDRGWDEAGNATWSEVMDYDQTIKVLAAAGVTSK